MNVKQEIKIIRRELKKRIPGLHVRSARGTAWGWVDISGSGEFGEFTDAQRGALKALGLQPGGNFANIEPGSRAYWVTKLTT